MGIRLSKWAKVLAAGLCSVLFVAGCSLAESKTVLSQAKEAAVLSPEEKAEKIVSQMTDAQKIGQLMMIGLQGTTLTADDRYMLTEFPCGNVILFDRNMQSMEQVKQLNESIQKTVQDVSGVPAFIGVDQEGGQVARMRNELPPMPSAAALGKQNPAVAKEWAVKTGTALKQIGCNINFAPVVDLDGAYERSYGKTPEEVIPYAQAVIEGYTQSNMVTTLKHFPGIGKVKTDPHIDGDAVWLSREELDAADGKPFHDLVAMMDPWRTAVMVSNVTFPKIDPVNPACLSQTIMTDILKNAYGYQGLIFTDDMEMGAMAKHYGFADMGVKAIQAGADIVLVCHDYGHEQAVYNGLLQAYRAGQLDKQQIDEKVKRIVLFKLKME